MITRTSVPVASSAAHAGAGAGAAAVAVATTKPPRTKAAAVSIGRAARQAATSRGGLVPAPRTRSPKVTVTVRGPTVGYAAATAAGSSNAELAFLRDPKLSLEEKLMRLLAHLSKAADAEVQKKMEELGKQPGESAGKAGTAANKARTAGNKKSGILDQLADVAGKAFGPAASALLKTPAFRTTISKMAGPVLAAAATALGAPGLAPLILKNAPKIVGALVSAAATSGGASTKSGAPAEGAALSEKDKELKLMEIQRLQNQQNEMFRLVSGILGANHQTRLAIIGNVR